MKGIDLDEDGVPYAINARGVALLGALVYDHPALLPVLHQHLVDQELEILTTMLLDEIASWMRQNLAANPVEVQSILDWLDLRYPNMHPDDKNLLDITILEFPEGYGNAGLMLAAQFGPNLLAATDPPPNFRKLKGWRRKGRNTSERPA